MADINILEKKIYVGKPTENDVSQYNYGCILEGDSVRILGKQRSNKTNLEADLYTTVTSQINKNLTEYPNGLLNGIGSEIIIDSAKIVEDNAESDGGRYVGVKVAFYIFDGDTTKGKAIANAKTGNQIRDAIGQGNSFADTEDGNRVGYWNKGDQTQDTSLGDVVSSVIFNNASEFPNKNTSTIPFNNIKKWTEYLTNVHEDDKSNGSYIWLVGRVSGDERETLWPFGTKTDERDREYVKLRIPKSELYGIWKNKKGETKEYSRDYSTAYSDNSKYRGDLGKYSSHNYRDNYGSGRGHGDLTNNVDPVNMFDEITLTVITSTFSPLNSIKSIDDGGMNANWVITTRDEGWHCVNTKYDVDDGISKTGERTGLNPKYDMDFTGFPDKFYTDSDSDGKTSTIGSYFSGSMINDFRPISFVSSSFNIDLQGYYDGDTRQHQELRVQSSIPSTVTLNLRLAESQTDFEPSYIDLTNDTNYNEFNYYYFVVNWDWKDGDPETLEQIGEAFPVNGDEYQTLTEQGLYELRDIKNNDTVSYSNYTEPGIKIIKAVVVSTINNTWVVGDTDYSDYVQAVQWKLVTIKINLTNDGAQITSDFGDIGGDDFTYLPYPDVVNLSRANNGNLGPPSDPDDGAYKSSHPVISGLSDESVYINSLKKINQVQPFGISEIDEKNSFNRAKSLSPIGDMKEWGDYLGQSDISQIRFFNKPYDMREMLGITTVSPDGIMFDNYNNFSYWNGEQDGNSFPKESPVGDIFISEYNQFKENCLVELNCGVLDGKTIKDTSGSGNKGILIGDYSVKKTKVGKLTTRDSYIKTPKTDSKNGAF